MSRPDRDPITPNSGLRAEIQDASADVLKQLLAKEYVLYVKTQNLHWNLTGMAFGALHELFGKQYAQLATFIDRIAEQIRKYGSAAPGSMQEFLALANSQEIAGMIISQVEAVTVALIGNEELAQFINGIDSRQLDLATQTLLGDVLDAHLKNAWMLRAHLE